MRKTPGKAPEIQSSSLKNCSISIPSGSWSYKGDKGVVVWLFLKSDGHTHKAHKAVRHGETKSIDLNPSRLKQTCWQGWWRLYIQMPSWTELSMPPCPQVSLFFFFPGTYTTCRCCTCMCEGDKSLRNIRYNIVVLGIGPPWPWHLTLWGSNIFQPLARRPL